MHNRNKYTVNQAILRNFFVALGVLIGDTSCPVIGFHEIFIVHMGVCKQTQNLRYTQFTTYSFLKFKYSVYVLSNVFWYNVISDN